MLFYVLNGVAPVLRAGSNFRFGIAQTARAKRGARGYVGTSGDLGTSADLGRVPGGRKRCRRASGQDIPASYGRRLTSSIATG